MESAEKTPEIYAIKLDLQYVHNLMSNLIPDWCCKEASSSSSMIMDTIHSCCSEEQHKMMRAFPEEVMAYHLFMMTRTSHFMDRLIGSDHGKQLDQILDQLRAIRERMEKEREEQAGDSEGPENRAMH